MKKVFSLIFLILGFVLVAILFSTIITWMMSVVLLVPTLLFAAFGVIPWGCATYVFIVFGVGTIFATIIWVVLSIKE